MTNTNDTTDANEAVVLKQDGLGRVQTSAERREQLLDEFERSGLSGKKFAALAGIKYQTFATWAQQRRRNKPGAVRVKSTGSLQWLEAVVEQAQNSGGKNSTVIVLHLPGGTRVEVADEKQAALAAAMVKALARSC